MTRDLTELGLATTAGVAAEVVARNAAIAAQAATDSYTYGRKQTFDIRSYGAVAGGTDCTTAITAAVAAAVAAGGGSVWVPPGVWEASTIPWSSQVLYRGEPGTSILRQRAATSGNFIVSDGFAAITLTGAQGGIQGGGLVGLVIDGNASNQATPNIGVAVYGSSFLIRNVEIRNCRGDGLYTEWCGALPNSTLLADGSMESFVDNVKLHGNTGWGWRHRGPHDTAVSMLFPFSNTAGGVLCESNNPTTIAAGSNGVSLPQATVNVKTTVGWPTAGTVKVTTGGGAQTVTYTGKTATSFTGCTGGTGAMATGGAVAPPGTGYSADGTLISDSHAWSNTQPIGWQADAQVSYANVISEGNSVWQWFIRASDVAILGFFYAAGSTGGGICIGDTANTVGGASIHAHCLGFAGSSAATAAINLANDSSGTDIDLTAQMPSGGSALWGTPSGESRLRIHQHGLNRATDTLGSINQAHGATRIDAGLKSQALVVQNGVIDLLNLSAAAGSERLELLSGTNLVGYSGQYSGITFQLTGGTGAASFAAGLTAIEATKGYVGVGTSPNAAIGYLTRLAADGDVGVVMARHSATATGHFMEFQDENWAATGCYIDSSGRLSVAGAAATVTAGAQSATAAASGTAKDIAGGVTTTAVAVPAAGPIATVTFAKAWGTTPAAVMITDRSANNRGLYVSAKSATAFTVSTRTAAGNGELVLFDYTVIGG